MNDFDVILRMDWLASYHIMMDCFIKIVKLRVDDTDKNVQFDGERRKFRTHVISALRTVRLMKVGCEGYIAFIAEDKHPQVVEEIPVVCEFLDVFWEEISSLPLVREIDFTIELVLGAAPTLRLHTEWLQ